MVKERKILTITEPAAEQIKSLLYKRNKPSLGIRVGVKSGGCSGRKYYIEYVDKIGSYDEIIEDKGVKVFIDPKALMYLIGAEMNYVREQFKSGFVFNNPNEKGNCGCGESFSA